MASYFQRLLCAGFVFFMVWCVGAQPGREKLLLDKDWRFGFGHTYDTEKDHGHATAYFSYLSKTGFGDGPADPAFDDRAWRRLDLPHDWAVEQPFSEKGSFSHGFKQSGKGFPDRSIGWYRKKIAIPQTDLGRNLKLQFDGVFRNAKVWFNGYFLGTFESGYTGFSHDVTDYVNYGGENTIVVRADASMEEGWFYEGAGIYRHVYLLKTHPLHIAQNGTYVTSVVQGQTAKITAQVTIENRGDYHGTVEIANEIYDPVGNKVASDTQQSSAPGFMLTTDATSVFTITGPQLWDIDNPNLYRLVTKIRQQSKIVDVYETTFGIRTVRFDPEQGFFLNDKPLKLKGTNNHQDHAGLGTALPDALQDFRIRKLKEMGSNAYRCSHHPPTPELLDACDRLGILVIDETRLMGTNDYHLGELGRMIRRDRNHPSVFCWSVGNEEWKIEGNIIGERVTATMQAFTKRLDPTRPVTVGISSGFKAGISSMIDVMGYNYLGNGDIDAHRNDFKHQPGMGTEEGSTFATRGIYFTDDAQHYKSAYDRKPRPSFYSIEEGWKFYATRPYLAGMFVWTGFDYRGEPTPYGWPSVTSYFGMMDGCGFPKDSFYYLKSWWTNEPMLHLFPHWNWQGKEGQEIDVWVYSNCDEVELTHNGKSLGRKKMEPLGHLEWKVIYQPGTLEAVGYQNGKKVLSEKHQTTGSPQDIKLSVQNAVNQKSNGTTIVAVSVADKHGRHIPTANHEISFEVKGGSIIGVGNGNPTSLEKDKFIDALTLVPITDLQEQPLRSADLPQNFPKFTGGQWQPAFKDRDYKNPKAAYAYQGKFVYDGNSKAQLTFFYQPIGVQSAVFVNGNLLQGSKEDPHQYLIPQGVLRSGENTVGIVATPIRKKNDWDVANTNSGVIQVVVPSGPWKRKLFNGCAQIILQQDDGAEDMILSATGEGLRSASLKIKKK
ncbi:beta-galactosidase GalA [Flavobacterium caeni]|uniref:Beta-galactosidase n=1 Tax=Flavobacterium caeni TaxID=490189 RepID=A0A1G5JX85_9FLAO|nr:beta-galactosidase GalA [Flavobacterium caeni]SCY92975.1 beta-galactosidase [Flavobacterium caeni]